jgi:hypothetical protein
VEFEGQPGVVLANDKLELTILTAGGSFAEIVLLDDPSRLNPLWNPARMAREVGQQARPGGYTGHFVCVDGFGPVSPEEQAAGLPGHGEACRAPWHLRSFEKTAAAGGKRVATVAFSVTLPIVQEVFRRTVQLVDGDHVVYVESELENLLGFDRPVNWAEHGTIGSPFLEPGKTVVDMSASRARTRPHPNRPGALPRRLVSARDFTWPLAPATGGPPVDIRAAPMNPNSSDHTASLMDTSRRLVFVTALHPGKRLLFGYLFRREEFPWTQNWESYQPTGRLARGLEFSTQPFDVPRREAIQTGTLFDTPTYRWLPAKSKIGSRFLMFYTPTPEGMTKVDDVRLENGRLTIEDRAAGKTVTLAASLPL